MRPIKRNREKYNLAVAEYVTESNCTIKYLAQKYHVDQALLSKYFKSLNIPIRRTYRKKETSDAIDQAILHYINMRDSIEKTASKFNISSETLGIKLKQLQLTRNGFNAPCYEVDENYFNVIDTADKAYWFGMIMSDGCVRSARRSGQLILELANVDYTHLQKFKSAISFSGPIISRNNRSTSLVRITRKKIFQDLSSKGCIPNKTYLGWINLGDIHGFEKDFLRGYCDGDGYLDKNRHRIIFTVKSDKIKESLLILTQDYKSYCRDNHYYNAKYDKDYHWWQIIIENKEGFYSFLKDIYLNATTFLDRKMLIALNRIQAHYGQLLSEDHRKIMRNLAGTTYEGESETEGLTVK